MSDPSRNGEEGRVATADRDLSEGPVCPTPARDDGRVQLGHGSGGKMSARLLRERFLPLFKNEFLDPLGDSAILDLGGNGEIAVSTDTFVVSPLEFPGGDIGALAVHGTVNDLAMAGARPLYLSAGFILEEGLSLEVLDRVLATMSRSAKEAGVLLVTGDTKVVERGKGDGLFVNTTGIGVMSPDFRPAPARARPGDAVLVSGPVGSHGMAIMAVREGIAFEAAIESDTANLSPLVEVLREEVGEGIHVLRDPTRGGVASAVNEIARAAGVGVRLHEGSIPIPPMVSAACEMLGLDPLYVANEGILVAFVEDAKADRALAALKKHALGIEAAVVGRVVDDHPGLVVLETGLGGTRVVDTLPGDQLPRIC
jgi:hydrogenase expression/formation protein HypE